jgi:hypothetical protein
VDGIARLAAVETRADLARGLAFAGDVLRGAPHPEIVVVSDGALDVPASSAAAGVPVRLLPIGVRGRNVAITGFSARRYPLDASRVEVLLEVTNTNDAPADVELTLLGDGNPLDVSRLSLKPSERLPRFYADLGGASRTLEARLRLAGGGADDLPADDRAYALMPERKRARVQVVTPGTTYLEAALLLDESLTTVPVTGYTRSGSFDVTIFDGAAPGAPEHGGAVYLNPPAVGGPVKLGRALEDVGFDTWDRKSPLLRWMAVENVQVARGHALVPESGDRVVGASELGPLLVSGRRGGRPFVALGFDPRDSDLVMRIAWPLFVLNVIHSFVEDDSSYLSSYLTGEPWRVPAPGSAPLAWVREPGGRVHEVAVEDGRAVFLGEHAGFHELLAAPGDKKGFAFAGNLTDPMESLVAPKKELVLGGATAKPVEGFRAGVRRETWMMLVVVAVLLSLIEWFTYHRRITV